MVKVFLVDDHEVVRRGLVDLLGEDPELDWVGEAGSVAEAMEKIPVACPDVALLDDWLPDGNGIELCRDLLCCMQALRCLLLTSFYTPDEAMLVAILAGCSGYVVKDIRGMQLASAIKDVGAGRSLMDNRAAAALMGRLRMVENHAGFWGLDDREQTLLDLVGEGLTNKQIADRMFLTDQAVRNYVSRLLAKLGVARSTQTAFSATPFKGFTIP